MNNKIKILWKSLAVFILSVLAGIAYRMGGSGNYPRYFRELGESSLMVITMSICGLFHWSLLICFGTMWGLLTTYFKKKGTDAKWWNWTIVGFAFGISMLPWAIACQYGWFHMRSHWWGFWIRTLICTIAVPLWCKYVTKDIPQEIGRGTINIITLALLMI